MSRLNHVVRRLRKRVSDWLVAKGLKEDRYITLSARQLRHLAVEKEFTDLVQHTPAIDKFTVKLYTTYSAVRYLLANDIQGDLLECGVYRGRHISMMALSLGRNGVLDRDLYLYDTFSGMTRPTELDRRSNYQDKDVDLIETWEAMNTESGNQIRNAGLEEVRTNVYATGYPRERFHFVEGDILETIPNQLHESIALLRLDTDWYELTRHELEHLYDLLAPGGILIIDDYGSHDGARRAVDEFFTARGFTPYLMRTSRDERVLVKYGIS